MKKKEEPSTQLVDVKQYTSIALYDEGKINDVVEAIKAKVKDITADVETPKGRKELISTAAKVASSKVFLDDLGKKHVESIKAQATKIDALRKKMREDLDKLKEEVRKPVTEYENREKLRIQNHQDNLEHVKSFTKEGFPERDLAKLEADLEALEKIEINESWEEFRDEGLINLQKSKEYLADRIASTKQREAEKKELEELRKKQAEVEQKARELEIIQQERNKAETDKQEALAKAEKEKEAAVLAERAKIAAEKAEEDRKKAAEEKIKQAKLADLERKKKINNTILAELVDIFGKTSEAKCKKLIKAIVNEEISYTFIDYSIDYVTDEV